MGGSSSFIFILSVILISCSTQVSSSQLQDSSGTNSNKVFCRFRNKEYAPGDVWYPTSSTSYGATCIVCTCLPSGRQNCTKQECPTDCQDRPQQHPCCKSCEEHSDSSQSGGRTTQEHHPSPHHHESGEEEEEEDGDLVTENAEFVSCLHQGRIYRDGESFTSNVTGLPIYATDQCMQCVCQTGMVLCQMKACHTFKCSGSGSDAHACCQRCAAWRKPRSEKEVQQQGNDLLGNKVVTGGTEDQRISSFESAITFRDVGGGGSSSPTDNQITPLITREKSNSGPLDDCVSAGRFYMQGSTWHPIIGPFGTMECVVCKCVKGQIDCGRLKCPAKREMPCPKPVKVEGHCCPICVSMISNDGGKMCVSGKQEITALRSHGVGINDTELINFAFVKERRGASGVQVDLHEWTLREGDDILTFSTRYISLPQFNDIKTRHTFTLIGATNEKNLDKFTRREKKLEKRCAIRCSARISSLERSLRIHRLIARKQCLTHERIVNT